MTRALCLLFAAWLVTTPAVMGQQPKPQPTDKQSQEIQQIDRARAALDSFAAAANAIAASRHYKCLVAFGHEPFCGCLRANIPLSMTLENYVTIATSTKEELGYATASKEDQAVVDATLKARDACTNKVLAR